MVFISVLAAVMAAIFLQYYIYRKYGFAGLEYNATLSADEVFAGDDIYLYEEIINTGRLPLPYVKIDTDLPEGLVFTLLDVESVEPQQPGSKPRRRGGRGVSVSVTLGQDEDKNNGIAPVKETVGLRRMRRVQSIQSLFVLRPRSRIRRRWRVTCRKRGEYQLGGVVVTANDLLGLNPRSMKLELPENKKNSIVVLPQPEDLAGKYASSRYLCGDVISNLCPVTDPIRICGSREYTPDDPMNRINWKSTAAHGRLMVNIEEKTVRHRFSLMLNMNSREIEQFPDTPSDTSALERCNIICTSILDRIASEDVPVRLYMNYPPALLPGGEAIASDDIGACISSCGPFRGQRDMIFALRTLAKLQMKISVPAERMFDHIVANPQLYSENENMIIVSSYLDGRMLNLHRAMAAVGVNVIFYIATTRNNVGVIPEGVDVYFSL